MLVALPFLIFWIIYSLTETNSKENQYKFMKKSLNSVTLKVLFWCALWSCVGLSLRAQASAVETIRISVSFDNTSLVKALEVIGQKSNLGVTFNDEDVVKIARISYQAKNKVVAEVLQDVLNNTKLSFRFYNNNIVIYRQKPVAVTGRVVDSKGEPMTGVTVTEKGTTNRTATNTTGYFTIKTQTNSPILIFSTVGFATVEREVSGSSTLTITMREDVTTLNEIVVVGYGTQKKKDLTGAISHLDMQGKEMTATTDITQALQGVTPGLNASSASKAGEVGGLSIRGRTSLSASDNPLIVLDGVIFNGSMGDIDINNVASIDVLKDASSAAVYGSRSANGVIVINTKRGNSDKPQFAFNTYYGIQSLSNTDMTSVLNPRQYAEHLVDYYYQQKLYTWYATNPTSATGRPVRPDVNDKDIVASNLRTEEEKLNYLAGNSVNWVDEVLRNAPIQSYSLTVSGKTPRTNYYLSTSYVDQKGITENDQYKRLTLFSKFENKINDWLTVEFDPIYSHRDYSGVETSLGDALIASPLGNMYDAARQYPIYIAGESYAYHPLANKYVTDSDLRDNINLVLKANVKIPFIKGLAYDINYNKNYIFDRHHQYFPKSVASGSQVGGSGSKSNSNSTKYLINNTLTYKRIFNNIHNIDVTLLHSEEELNAEATTATGTGFNSEKLGYNGLQLAQKQSTTTSGSREFTRSFLARVNYVFKDRYLFTANVRRDGYSGFGPNRKWGNFPSASAGWILSEESFLENVKPIDFLKLRLSYGVNGNQGIGVYRSQSKMDDISTVFNGITAIGLYASSMGNNNLGWEKTSSANLGLDFRVLDNRINGTIDVYKAKTTDVLVERAIPTITGNSSVWDNIGGMENKGIEISLETHNFRNDAFKWTSAVAFSINRNKITKLYSNVTQDIGNSWFVGKSSYAVYGYQTNGVWQEEDLFNKTITATYYPGQFRIIDQDGDGTISADKDRVVVGSTDANYRVSLTNNFSYKRFSLSVIFNSIQGGNGYYMASNTAALVTGGTDKAFRLNRPAIRPYWTPDNPVNDAPGMYNNPKIAPAVYQDKSFIRLQDVTLSYNTAEKLAKKMGLKNLRLYVSGRNLHTWTDWSGWDPEVQNPLIRSVIGGLSTSF